MKNVNARLRVAGNNKGALEAEIGESMKNVQLSTEFTGMLL